MKLQMKNVSIRSIGVLILVLGTLWTSCRKKEPLQPAPAKEETPPPPPAADPMSGTWIGTYDLGSPGSDAYFALRLSADGTMEVLDNEGLAIGNGNWVLEDASFTATYVYTGGLNVKYYLAAKHAEDEARLSGSWGTDEQVGSGDFILDKQ